MDLLHLDKLIEEQKKVLEQNENARKHRMGLRDDYCKLKDKLNTLADQTSHNFMVPIGSVGFFPGKLLHTNEIMVLLGDNWFVERSTKQAQEIVNRRIKLIDGQLGDLKKEHDNIKSQNEFTGYFKEAKETEDIKEIREEISQDLSSSNGKIRKAHTPKHNLFPRRVDMKKVTSKNPVLSHDELFARLNELEHEELIAEELEQINAMNLLSESNENSEERHVKFKNHPVCGNEPVFNSPADIYDKHMHQDLDDKPLKSILKKDSRSNSNENLRLKPILKSSPEHNSLLDDDYRMLKTPPDNQLNEMTPEFTDDPKSILKSHESCHNRSKQCSDVIQDDEDQVVDEKRSILKNSKDYIRPVTPDDELHKGILKSEPKKVVIKNPETIPIVNEVDHDEVDHVVDSNYKNTTKNQMPFSGTVLERNIHDNQSVKIQEYLGNNKPVSKFKASRLKK